MSGTSIRLNSLKLYSVLCNTKQLKVFSIMKEALFYNKKLREKVAWGLNALE